jgi:catechol 2,3-dioxygenase-like lactoylglutathione lyase family enzyme
MPVVGLGHTGLWVHDLEKMRDFYERVIGLTVTDADDEQGIVNAEAERLLADGGPRLPAGHLDAGRRPCPGSGTGL